MGLIEGNLLIRDLGETEKCLRRVTPPGEGESLRLVGGAQSVRTRSSVPAPATEVLRFPGSSERELPKLPADCGEKSNVWCDSSGSEGPQGPIPMGFWRVSARKSMFFGDGRRERESLRLAGGGRRRRRTLLRGQIPC